MAAAPDRPRVGAQVGARMRAYRRAGQRLAGAATRRVIATGRVWSPGDAHLAVLGGVTPDALMRGQPRPGLLPSVAVPGGRIDWPAPSTLLPRSVVHIHGWAMTAAGPCSRVELTLDGAPLTRARLGDVRPDVEEATMLRSARLSGFRTTVDLSALPAETDRVTLGGVAIGLDQATVQLPALPLRVAGEVAPAQDAAQPSPVPLDSRGADVKYIAPADARSPMRSGRDPLRVLVGTHDLDYGGAQLVLVELMRRISERSKLTGVILAPSDGPLRAAFEALGFTVHLTSDLPIGSSSEYEARFQELEAWAGVERFDVAFVNTMLAFPLADLASRLGLPTVWAIHESYALPCYWAEYGSALDPAVRRRAEVVLEAAQVRAFVCEATRSLYESHLPPVRCVSLPYGIDVAALDEWRGGFDRDEGRRHEQIPDDATVILCVGTIEPRKSQTQLVHAFAQIADRHPRALLCLVGSREDEHSAAVRNAVAMHGLERRVRVQPVVPDTRPNYGIADVVVSASDVESSPRCILEAMTIGVPVLSTDVYGVPEIITHGVTGWLCEARDVMALAHGLDELLGVSEPERLAVVANARAVIEDRYRSDVCAREWDRLLHEVAALGSRPASMAS